MSKTKINLVDIIDGVGHSPNSERTQIRELDKLVSTGQLEIETVEYTPKGALPIMEAASVSASGRNKESDNHVRLKAVMANYLDTTESKPVFEQRKWYGITDVGSGDGTRAVECGTVRVGKLIEAFGYESSIPLLGEINPAYGCLDELLYVPYSLNSDYPPVTILSIKPR